MYCRVAMVFFFVSLRYYIHHYYGSSTDRSPLTAIETELNKNKPNSTPSRPSTCQSNTPPKPSPFFIHQTHLHLQETPHSHLISSHLHSRSSIPLRRNNTPPPLPPHDRQHNRTRCKKHTTRHPQSPNGLGLKALGPTTARPPRQTHHRTPLPARSERHRKSPSTLRRTGCRGAADRAAVEVADRAAEQDGDDGEGEEEQGVESGED